MLRVWNEITHQYPHFYTLIVREIEQPAKENCNSMTTESKRSATALRIHFVSADLHCRLHSIAKRTIQQQPLLFAR